tara:strand:- start:6198 stop:6365 length:168 start_codon:yes stop_codon:yes gene_type:complete
MRSFLDGDPSPAEERLIYLAISLVVVALIVASQCAHESPHRPAERRPDTPPESLY